MNDKERKVYEEELKKMEEFAKKITSKKEAIRFLHGAGICTKSGKLTKFYR